MIALPKNQRFMQICWVVPDIQAAMATWTRTAGVGPFFFFDDVPAMEPHYHGKPVEAPKIWAAIAQAGDMQIELVSSKDDLPGVFNDFVPKGQSGLHHMALVARDYDAELAVYEAAGAKVVYSIMMMGKRVCYIDTYKQLGFLIELMEENPIAGGIFAQFRNAAENWDGKDPVRTLG